MTRLKGQLAAMKYLANNSKNIRLVFNGPKFFLEELLYDGYYETHFWKTIWEVDLGAKHD